MTDSSAAAATAPRVRRPGYENNEKTWYGQIPLISATAIISAIAAIGMNFGGKIVSSGETSAVLTAQMQILVDSRKDDNRLLQDLTLKASELYTRREAQTDRDAAERRFTSMEGRINEIGKRLETVESNQRFMENLVTRSGQGRHP